MKYEKYYEDESPVFPEKMELGKLLRKIRLLSKLSQTEFAEEFGFNQKTISGYERGAFSPSFEDANYMLRRMGLGIYIAPMKNNTVKQIAGTTDSFEIHESILVALGADA